MFALLSALEIDLREFIELNVIPAVGKSALLGAELQNKCTERFLRDNPAEVPQINDLIEFLDLGDTIQLLRRKDSVLDDSTRTYLKRYNLSLDGTIPIRNRVTSRSSFIREKRQEYFAFLSDDTNKGLWLL
jgi:hypothetical protein